jgi:hypothetical protein
MAALVFGVAGIPFTILFGAAWTEDHDVMLLALPLFFWACLAWLTALSSLSTLPSLLAGWGLLRYRSWARVLTMILSFCDLFSFPLGTALGTYSLWVLFHPETIRLFERGYRNRSYSY